MSFYGDDSAYEIQQQDLKRIMAMHKDDKMPSRPPETKFYEDEENAGLWRDQSRLYEEFLGPDSEKWSDREERFVIVLNDLQVKLREMPRRASAD